MKKVAIIGVGLIGGSIALCLKKRLREDIVIHAYDKQDSRLHLAQSLGVIDEGYTDLDRALRQADFVFLCTPVQTLCELLKPVLLSVHIKEGCIITDVGSTKSRIVSLSEQFSAQSKGIFIGGHPMAGSHKSGVEAANDRLFENAYYVLTPSKQTNPEHLQTLKELLACTRAQIIQMSAREHDEVVGAISHFPHVIASSLVEHVFDYQQQNEWYFRLAAGGFRDITRIASSSPRMWRDIVLSNHSLLVSQLKDWIKRMQEVSEMIESRDAERIESFFAHAKQVRDELPEKNQGAIPSFFDLYVDIPDHPGVIGQITTLLGIHEISITNIAILETREDIMGVLRLSFRNESDMEKAEKVMQDAHYLVYRP